MTREESINQLAKGLIEVQAELGSVPKGLASAIHNLRRENKNKGEPMNRVKWEVPSVPKAGRGCIKGKKWAPVQLMLMENPEKWALIISSPKQSSVPPEFSGSKYKRAYRKVDGVYKIYVMYVGQ